jgi:hypothetical protein
MDFPLKMPQISNDLLAVLFFPFWQSSAVPVFTTDINTFYSSALAVPKLYIKPANHGL